MTLRVILLALAASGFTAGASIAQRRVSYFERTNDSILLRSNTVNKVFIDVIQGVHTGLEEHARPSNAPPNTN